MPECKRSRIFAASRTTNNRKMEYITSYLVLKEVGKIHGSEEASVMEVERRDLTKSDVIAKKKENPIGKT